MKFQSIILFLFGLAFVKACGNLTLFTQEGDSYTFGEGCSYVGNNITEALVDPDTCYHFYNETDDCTEKAFFDSCDNYTTFEEPILVFSVKVSCELLSVNVDVY
ncbi:6079_t:CDS:2 [Ambispora leptoticha]|uniref:6079_t:CDS:1 n=1 Tax=Ambispora leptoticha TaxID=144679 RepID=A0A9N9AZ43_9GLOM|nr:6079_t:CDS:2 [Ambispora leptoticha]